MKPLIACLAAAILCGCRAVPSTAPPTVPAADAKKIELRNNAASLLHDLLDDEKNVGKVLILKRNSAELGRLIKMISTVAGDGARQLETLAKTDPSWSLRALQLPAGEMAARAAVSKTKEHELLFNSGEDFEFYLLLTQTEALSYGSHLAGIVAKNSPAPGQAREFQELGRRLDDLFQQVVAKMRALPPK